MRGGKISIHTVRQRMERLEERTNETQFPPIEQLFRKIEDKPELTKDFVEHMTFSSYPECKEASASALKAMLSRTVVFVSVMDAISRLLSPPPVEE